jgi:hypothetical protein
MKRAVSTQQPRLLTNSSPHDHWQIQITLRGAGLCVIILSDRNLAQREYQRLCSQGAYLGHWIDNITLDTVISH